jgi:hypothetical protein
MFCLRSVDNNICFDRNYNVMHLECVDRIMRINITKKYHFPFLVKIDQFSLKYDCDCVNSVIDIQIIHLQERKKKQKKESKDTQFR